MSVSRRHALLAGAAAAVPLTAWLAAARGQGPATATPGSTPAAAFGEDPLLAACLLIGGRKQIENCSYALKKLQTDDAKAFAKAEIEEHETVKAELKKLGYDYPVTVTPAATGRGAPAGARPTMVVAAGKLTLSPDAVAMIAVDHEVADQCIANYRKEMDPLAGLKLDKRFVGHQLDEHFALRDKAETFRRHASKLMAPTLDEGLKVIEAHIAALKALMAKLDDAKDKDAVR